MWTWLDVNWEWVFRHERDGRHLPLGLTHFDGLAVRLAIPQMSWHSATLAQAARAERCSDRKVAFVEKEHSHVESDFNFRADGRRGSGVSPLLDARTCGIYGGSRGCTHPGLGVAPLALSHDANL
jgi:hypothetical protein